MRFSNFQIPYAQKIFLKITGWLITVENGIIRSVRTYHAQFGEQNPNGYAVCVHHISCLYVLFELFENSKRSATLQCSKNCVPFLWDAKLIL